MTSRGRFDPTERMPRFGDYRGFGGGGVDGGVISGPMTAGPSAIRRQHRSVQQQQQQRHSSRASSRCVLDEASSQTKGGLRHPVPPNLFYMGPAGKSARRPPGEVNNCEPRAGATATAEEITCAHQGRAPTRPVWIDRGDGVTRQQQQQLQLQQGHPNLQHTMPEQAEFAQNHVGGAQPEFPSDSDSDGAQLGPASAARGHPVQQPQQQPVPQSQQQQQQQLLLQQQQQQRRIDASFRGGHNGSRPHPQPPQPAVVPASFRGNGGRQVMPSSIYNDVSSGSDELLNQYDRLLEQKHHHQQQQQQQQQKLQLLYMQHQHQLQQQQQLQCQQQLQPLEVKSDDDTGGGRQHRRRHQMQPLPPLLKDILDRSRRRGGDVADEKLDFITDSERPGPPRRRRAPSEAAQASASNAAAHAAASWPRQASSASASASRRQSDLDWRQRRHRRRGGGPDDDPVSGSSEDSGSCTTAGCSGCGDADNLDDLRLPVMSPISSPAVTSRHRRQQQQPQHQQQQSRPQLHSRRDGGRVSSRRRVTSSSTSSGSREGDIYGGGGGGGFCGDSGFDQPPLTPVTSGIRSASRRRFKEELDDNAEEEASSADGSPEAIRPGSRVAVSHGRRNRPWASASGWRETSRRTEEIFSCPYVELLLQTRTYECRRCAKCCPQSRSRQPAAMLAPVQTESTETPAGGLGLYPYQLPSSAMELQPPLNFSGRRHQRRQRQHRQIDSQAAEAAAAAGTNAELSDVSNNFDAKGGGGGGGGAGADYKSSRSRRSQQQQQQQQPPQHADETMAPSGRAPARPVWIDRGDGVARQQHQQQQQQQQQQQRYHQSSRRHQSHSQPSRQF